MKYFYPRSPCGERLLTGVQKSVTWDFYPRSPCGERLDGGVTLPPHEQFLSTLSLRRATIPLRSRLKRAIISIHALLAESDDTLVKLISNPTNFYPRSPCGERHIHIILVPNTDDFYPRSPCGERQIGTIANHRDFAFLSTLSLRRATWICTATFPVRVYFYPRSPCGERRHPERRAAGDRNFYPRSPCGERPQAVLALGTPQRFLSTLSLRRATFHTVQIVIIVIFLSTLSLRRATIGRG